MSTDERNEQLREHVRQVLKLVIDQKKNGRANVSETEDLSDNLGRKAFKLNREQGRAKTIDDF